MGSFENVGIQDGKEINQTRVHKEIPEAPVPNQKEFRVVGGQVTNIHVELASPRVSIYLRDAIDIQSGLEVGNMFFTEEIFTQYFKTCSLASGRRAISCSHDMRLI